MFIHPTAVVETKDIGKDVYIGPFCYIGDNVTIEDGCVLYGHCSIGGPAQYKPALPEYNALPIHVGAGTEIREFVTINRPTTSKTVVGHRCFLMANVHIPHDCIVGNDVVFVVGAAIGGFTEIGDHCYIGLNATTHNKSVLGDYCVVGASSFFKGNSPAGLIWAGVPARALKVNSVGIERNAPKDLRTKILNSAEDALVILRETRK